MKINLDTTLFTIDAAIAAYILVHLPLELTTSILFMVGFAVIVYHDYGRNRASLAPHEAESSTTARPGENLPLAS